MKENENKDILKDIKKTIGGIDDDTISKINEARRAINSVNSLALDMATIHRSIDEYRKISNFLPHITDISILESSINYLPIITPENWNELEKIKEELKKTSKRNEELIAEINSQQIAEDEKKLRIIELEENSKSMEKKAQIIHITSRIHPSAVKKILHDSEFLNKFTSEAEFEASVISIDIRRSTDLMLEANSPKEYSNFIFELTTSLKNSVINNYGIFDKFTGDGILAFFPKFYSSKNSIILAQKTAIEAHAIFNEIYNKYSSSFSLLLSDVGLGIGIDFGKLHIYESPSELSVVGKPVVYACRFSSTKAYTTLNNQGALNELKALIGSEKIKIETVQINIKNKGNCQGFIIDIDPQSFKIDPPEWA